MYKSIFALLLIFSTSQSLNVKHSIFGEGFTDLNVGYDLALNRTHLSSEYKGTFDIRKERETSPTDTTRDLEKLSSNKIAFYCGYDFVLIDSIFLRPSSGIEFDFIKSHREYYWGNTSQTHSDTSDYSDRNYNLALKFSILKQFSHCFIGLTSNIIAYNITEGFAVRMPGRTYELHQLSIKLDPKILFGYRF